VSDKPVDLTKFREAVEARRARQAEEAKAAALPVHDDDLIPDAGYDRSDQDKELDRVIESIGIIDAYSRWCGKSTPKVYSGQTESIKVSCPKPDHPDKDPSAWLNTEKNTWFCGGCQEGGDVYDIAAYNLGMPVPGYKTGAAFHELRRKMAESMGYTFVSAPGLSSPIPVAPEAEPEAGQEPEATAAVVAISDDLDADSDDWDDELIEFPTFDWRSIMQPQTFLDAYMRATHVDDVPEEYHLWNGLLALGLSVGRDVILYDRVPVYGNLFLCLLGNTGDGKSRSFSHLRRLLRTALPHKWDEPGSKGTHFVGTPASAEVLIHNFSKPVLDPADPKRISHYAPVRGLVEFNELSALTGRTSRQGNVLKPTLMEFYDMAPTVTTSSMTTGKKEAEQPFASVYTSTQPRALKELMRKSDSDSGFLNRWIFASGQPKQRIAIGGIKIDTTPAVKPLQDIAGWAGFGKEITWDAEAAELFTSFFHSTLHPAQQRDRQGFLTRLDLTMKKLILLLTVNIQQNSVPKEIVEQVISMYPYLIAAYEVPAAQIGNSQQVEVQDRLIQVIKTFQEKTGKPPSYRDIFLRIKRQKYPPDLIHKTLKIISDMGIVDPITTQAGKVGRPTVRYKYVG
jgi:hypothetical protein